MKSAEKKLKPPQSTPEIKKSNSLSVSIVKNKIMVYVRIRPLLENEAEDTEIFETTENSVILQDGIETQEYQFDKVFSKDTMQIQMLPSFKESFHRLFEGFNMTVFAYGQTGSGFFF